MPHSVPAAALRAVVPSSKTDAGPRQWLRRPSADVMSDIEEILLAKPIASVGELARAVEVSEAEALVSLTKMSWAGDVFPTSRTRERWIHRRATAYLAVAGAFLGGTSSPGTARQAVARSSDPGLPVAFAEIVLADLTSRGELEVAACAGSKFYYRKDMARGSDPEDVAPAPSGSALRDALVGVLRFPCTLDEAAEATGAGRVETREALLAMAACNRAFVCHSGEVEVWSDRQLQPENASAVASAEIEAARRGRRTVRREDLANWMRAFGTPSTVAEASARMGTSTTTGYAAVRTLTDMGLLAPSTEAAARREPWKFSATLYVAAARP